MVDQVEEGASGGCGRECPGDDGVEASLAVLVGAALPGVDELLGSSTSRISQ